MIKIEILIKETSEENRHATSISYESAETPDTTQMERAHAGHIRDTFVLAQRQLGEALSKKDLGVAYTESCRQPQG